MKTIELKESFRELYKVKNDVCPICDKKFIFVSPIIKIEDKAYHLHCYEKLTIR